MILNIKKSKSKKLKPKNQSMQKGNLIRQGIFQGKLFRQGMCWGREIILLTKKIIYDTIQADTQ